MGTTVVVLYISDQQAFLGHVGDSRIYLYRDNVLKQLTKDHSKVQNLIDIGMIGPEDAAQHPEANVITRCLGTREDVSAEILRDPVQVMPDDLFLLCSDGLWGMVPDTEIEKRVSGKDPLDVMCKNLVSDALSAGGEDNVTVQLIAARKTRADRNGQPKKSIPYLSNWLIVLFFLVLFFYLIFVII